MFTAAPKTGKKNMGIGHNPRNRCEKCSKRGPCRISVECHEKKNMISVEHTYGNTQPNMETPMENTQDIISYYIYICRSCYNVSYTGNTTYGKQPAKSHGAVLMLISYREKSMAHVNPGSHPLFRVSGSPSIDTNFLEVS